MVTLGTTPPRGRGRTGWFDAVAASPRPAVVDYSAEGDRVELSGRVLANWAAKTANLLEAEGFGPGAAVALDLPVGWKPLAVLLGAARAGVEVVFAAGPAPADLAITDVPGPWAGAASDLWAVSPGTRDEDVGADLPAHALDYTAEVRVQADQCPLPVPPGDLPSLAAGWRDAAVHDAGTTRWSRRERGLVVAARGGRLDRAVAGAVAGTWDAGLPVVVVPAGHADADETARPVAAERLGSPVG